MMIWKSNQNLNEIKTRHLLILLRVLSLLVHNMTQRGRSLPDIKQSVQLYESQRSYSHTKGKSGMVHLNCRYNTNCD